MKKNVKLLAILFSLILVLGLFASCGGGETPASTDPDENPEDVSGEVPSEVQAVMDKVTTLAADYALQLDGEFGDQHLALIESGQGWDYVDHDAMKAVLDGFRVDSGAYYVYCLIDADPSDDYFEITVDGSEEPDDWYAQYEIESQFLAAMEGTPTPAPSAWDNDVDDPVWSSFAPIHDSQGNIVAILGVDYPAPEILDFPEWNRDSDEFIEQ